LFYNGKLIAYSGSKYYGTANITTLPSISIYKIKLFGWDSEIATSSNTDMAGYNGYIDDFVFIRDQALWTTEFTPPTGYLYTPQLKQIKQY
jgi:hypothetical protein